MLGLGSEASGFPAFFPTSIYYLLIPKDIPGSFCEFWLFCLTEAAIGKPGWRLPTVGFHRSEPDLRRKVQ